MTDQNGNRPSPGFQIGGRFYPAPTSFRLGDPVLVTELTGMSWQEFIDKLDDDEENAVLMLGIVGVAVWQQNPTWKRERVVGFVQGVGFDQIEAVGTEEDDAAPDPPLEGGEPTSTGSLPESSGSQDSTLLTLNPPTSGQQASTTGAQA